MTSESMSGPAAIRAARAADPEPRERDFAARHGISEAELVAAHCGQGVTRLEPRVDAMLSGLAAVGTVMALTRNDSAVHEKIGVYEKTVSGGAGTLVLGPQIDLRVFPKAWVHAFAVEKRVEGAVRHSLQVFDAAGTAVHKVHLRPESDGAAYRRLVETLAAADQSQTLAVAPVPAPKPAPEPSADVAVLRARWEAMTDVHQFVAILRDMKLTRRQAVGLVGADFAWRVETGALRAMMEGAVAAATPIMCFIGNHGCIQIHSGPIANVRPMGPWLNVMDPTFHMHLRQDHIRELWAVRKPTDKGHVTSLEGYDAAGRMAIQFFGQRQEGQDERVPWRRLVEALPRSAGSAAA